MHIRFLLIPMILNSSLGLYSSINRELLIKYVKNIPNVTNYQVKGDADNIYILADTEIGDSCYFFISNKEEEIRGYQDNNKIIVQIDNEKKLKRVELIQSRDTPSFVRKIKKSNFLDQFVNWNDEREIKSITGATVTCNSIQATVRNLLKRVKETL